MARYRMILCDDEPNYRRLVRTVLEPIADIDFVEARDGQECMEKAGGEAPDYILLDLNMPKVDGYQALPELRSIAPDAKIVALSTARPEDAEQRSLDLGANAFVEKPRNILDLPAMICEKLAAAS